MNTALSLAAMRKPTPVELFNTSGELSGAPNEPWILSGLLFPVQVCPRWSWLLSLSQVPVWFQWPAVS